MREMTSHLSALSLNAPWNCVTMSAQKPREDAGGVSGDAGVGFGFTPKNYQTPRQKVN